MGMSGPDIERALEAAERAVADGRGLAGTGFWPAVSAAKRDPALVEAYGDRIASIDRGAFENWALLTLPPGVGTLLMVAATAVSLGLVAASYWLDSPWNVLSFLAGFGALLVTTHGLGHLVVGALVGIEFTHWFIGTISRPQPGVKVDYASYLATPARSRAWMHAAGALTTKFIPFLMVGVVVYAELPAWLYLLLGAVAFVTITTDIIWSTKSSDWKKFRREMAFAQTS